MGINTGQPAGLTAITTGDTVLDDNASVVSGTHDYYSHYVHNTLDSGADIVVEFFASSDALSAIGERVDYLIVPSRETLRIRPVLLKEGQYLLAKASALGLNWYGTFTKRTGSDK